MTHTPSLSGPILQEVFDFLCAHPGARFLLADIFGQVGCTPTQARLALATLVQNGLIDQEATVEGRNVYVYRPRDPLLSR
jgi:hypothetical protein